MSADRARYILQCAEKERDELLYRMQHAAPNDAIHATGQSILNAYNDKVAQAKRNVEEYGIPAGPSVQANLAARETDRILRVPRR